MEIYRVLKEQQLTAFLKLINLKIKHYLEHNNINLAHDPLPEVQQMQAALTPEKEVFSMKALPVYQVVIPQNYHDNNEEIQENARLLQPNPLTGQD